MGTYKGNKGNLMQHWTLCEVLSIAKRNHDALNFIDAHAMAPLARERAPEKVHQGSEVFNRVQTNLPGQKSTYEKAWQSLAPKPSCGYPNSANFVRHIWRGHFSMLLCEINPTTAEEIDSWLAGVRGMSNYKNADLQPGDWRDTLNQGLPSLKDVSLGDDALTLVSFDPNEYNIAGDPQQGDYDMYPIDLGKVITSLSALEGGVLVQLSTYSRGNANQNKQGAVISSVTELFSAGGFLLAAVLWANGDMMSLIFTRNVEWWRELAVLPSQFRLWLVRC